MLQFKYEENLFDFDYFNYSFRCYWFLPRLARQRPQAFLLALKELAQRIFIRLGSL